MQISAPRPADVLQYPYAHALEGVIVAGIAGVYRSEKHVVIERNRYRFPQHCIWCNSAIDDQPAAAPGTRETVTLPVCGSCAKRRNLLPRIVGVAGVLSLIAAPAAYSMLGVFVAAALFISGWIDLAIAYWLHQTAKSGRMVREDEQYLWIAGADSKFLASLPQWPGMKLGELAARDN
jgi:hypothetical protein